ncbi:cbb3-type cytochrome c oxidase N-terminal domain-containing protein [Aquirufa regiilacus]|uniref:cbb3-type cytochrome c oxidase N-terminal domain-containing protein n=1 Tax=Aquirufa regiilacus TaxID=3024868 RepID=UPI0028E01FDB|nr:cbb3-type cytochrome c oxidase N-terminal domain-containing protein [Aquirufa sp. LEPPI-3A]MDT8887269.1 cbb3-type cytochrome c oxidase N-terminal domain-containing protein [Aquirufa sp. LEPPI-3A]
MALTFMEIWLISLIFLTGIIILVVTLQLNSALKKLTKNTKMPVEAELSWWEKFKGLRPLEQEGELLMEHTYDGIAELDNPTPPWFMYLFYSTIIFGLIYGAYYHVYQDGNIQEGEYKTEVAAAEKAREAYMKQFANSVNEDNVTVSTAAKDLTEGSQIYSTNCVACHGDKGQGGVGPNLTDKFWIHGGGIKDLFKTITHGIPEKGMIAWEKTLNPLQVQKVASFILTLQGSNPPGAKEPQGEEIK